MNNQSTFSQLISSPTLWGIFITFVLAIIKIVDPAFLSTDAFATIIGLLSVICAYFHIPVQLTANASLNTPVVPPQA